MTRPIRPTRPVPTRDAVLRYIRESSGRVGKREITRALGITTELRPQLRAVLHALKQEGKIAPAGHRRFIPPARTTEAIVLRVTGTDADGDAIARPVDWSGDGPPPLVTMAAERPGQPALAPGDRVLARLKPLPDRGGPPRFEGRTLKRLSDEPGRILGVFRAAPSGSGGRIVPTDRRAKAEWVVSAHETAGAETDEIVAATPLPHNGLGLKPARITERLGRMGDARSISLICIHAHDIPQDFSPDALADAARARVTRLGRREDLRGTALITIDGADARDFDDAVYAEPAGTGWRLLVAIADVAHYVRPGTPLDRDAYDRGNSVYFPDRVVPMLPEALSNGWCSLRPDEDRGCLFVEMHIDASGRKTSHRFGRGLMRSVARMTYEQVQTAHDSGDMTNLGALYPAFRALLAARLARGTLDLDLPERQVILAEGRVESVRPRPRLDSHRLIEEFMVLANVAAAEQLESYAQPCMYRVHAPPTDDKLDALRTFLHSMGISLPPGDAIHPRDLDRVLTQVKGTEQAAIVNDIILRSQSQAAYSPDNLGHFGLALPRYAHFTSPIRRYADLLVHRALIAGGRMGLGKLDNAEGFVDAGDHISATERRAALAEREAVDRYLAAYMADRVGATFPARISGVQRFGMFVTLDDTGASGLIPMSGMPDDYWLYDEPTQSLAGSRSRQVYQLAQALEVRLVEANAITGGLIFAIAGARTRAAPAPKQKGRRR